MTPEPIEDIIRKRYSCRNYLPESIPAEKQTHLNRFIAGLGSGPFGTGQRFALVAATDGDRSALRRLGTYGYIKNPPGFIIGATKAAQYDLEDYGYQMERIILEATRIGLGTCWLGGTFTKSSFPRKIAARPDELVPAVTAIGNPASRRRWIEIIRRPDPTIERRLPFDTLFFEGDFDHPMAFEDAGEYSLVLEMVRRAPSASNKQPWRVIRTGQDWHFYLQRTPGYRDQFLVRWATVADMQRLDMGIAMAHFELTAHEVGLPGGWIRREPDVEKPGDLTEYVVSWIIEENQG
jgi:nitroreductase